MFKPLIKVRKYIDVNANKKLSNITHLLLFCISQSQ